MNDDTGASDSGTSDSGADTSSISIHDMLTPKCGFVAKETKTLGKNTKIPTALARAITFAMAL